MYDYASDRIRPVQSARVAPLGGHGLLLYAESPTRPDDLTARRSHVSIVKPAGSVLRASLFLVPWRKTAWRVCPWTQPQWARSPVPRRSWTGRSAGSPTARWW